MSKSKIQTLIQLLKTGVSSSSSQNDSNAEDAIIYGIRCKRIEDGDPYKGEIYISEMRRNSLYFANIDKDEIEEIDIEKVELITFKSKSENLKEYEKKRDSEVFIQILLDRQSKDFCFKNNEKLNLFCLGLSKFLEKNNNYSRVQTHKDFDNMINKFNSNLDENIDENEIESLSKEMGIDKKRLKKEIDTNGDGKVSKEEFEDYFTKKFCNKEITDLFNRYTNRSPSMNALQLKRFFEVEEKENISELEAYQLITFFNINKNEEKKKLIIENIEKAYKENNSRISQSEVDKIINDQNINNSNNKGKDFKNSINLFEFSLMLNSRELEVYDRKIMNKELDLDHPLTDYYMRCTHNTYLTGHQLTSKSSEMMYSLAMLYGYRLVELDCYNASGDDIKITHGYTLATNLEVRDILRALKETAFYNSSLPVVLTIENHLDAKHIEILVQRFKDILVDLYTFPTDIKPRNVPNLRDLQNKFIIRAGGQRIWQGAKDILPLPPSRNEYKNNEKENPLEKFILINKKNNKKEYDLSKLEQKRNSNPQMIYDESKYKTLTDGNNKNKYNDVLSLKDNEKNNEMKGIKTYAGDSKLNFASKLLTPLEKIRGITGTKFSFEEIDKKDYKPWESVSLKCDTMTSYCDNIEKRKKILETSQYVQFKIYPEKFNSDNYNVIKCWACGAQGAALNIQATKDDFTLYDKIFFKQYQNKGYILKPAKFLSPNNKNNFPNYSRPAYTLELKIISIINLTCLIEQEKIVIDNEKEITMNIYSVGVKEDENNESKEIQLTGGVIFPHFKNSERDSRITMKVFEPDLSGIMIKFEYDGEMIGRGCIPYCMMKEGYRRITIYDNNCNSKEEAYIIGYFRKSSF